MDFPQLKFPSLCINDEEAPLKRSPLAPLQWQSINQNLLSLNEKPCNAFYLSPLETETVRRKRAQQFGLTPPVDPFLHNQSLPYAHKYPENGNSCVDMGESRKCTIDKFKGDSLNSISFSPSPVKASYPKVQAQRRHLSGSWLFYRYVEGGPASASIQTSLHNPNKAVVTINARTSEILICNKIASYLLGIKDQSKERRKLCDYILSREDQYTLTEIDLKPTGELVLISGKVMDLITPVKRVIPVSVWARQLHTDEDPRCLVVMEPVERITGTVKLDFSGKVVSCDNSFATVYGYPCVEDMKGLDIRELIPSVELDLENNCGDLIPKEGLKQCATGKTKDGSHFPLTIMIQPCSSENSQDPRKEKTSITYKGVIWVFNNISGMITLLPDGTIHSCNTNFSLLLFGYSQNELVGKSISILIPTFYEDVEFLDTDSVALPPFDDDDDSNARCCCASDGRTTADSIGTDPPRPVNPMGKHVELLVDEATEGIQNFAFSPSPSENQISLHYNQLSPFLKDRFDFNEEKIQSLNEKAVEGDCSKHDELSESSSHYGNSSKHLSCSESQDTLHSCTNSITESDFNANVLDPSDCEECPEKVENSQLNSCKEKKAGNVSVDCFSESSDNEESFSSLAEDFLPNKLDSFPPCDNTNSLNVLDMQINAKTRKTERFHSPPCSRLSESSSNSYVQMKASTPKISSQSAAMPMTDDSLQSLPEGGFYGIGCHKDGTDLAIEYYIKKVMLDDGKQLYCLWVSRDPEEIRENVSEIPPPSASSTTSRSGTNYTDRSSKEDDDQSSSSSIMSDSFYISGEFSDHYAILQHIGKGAFGCVKKAHRNKDGLLVIAKFIRKSDVYKELWVYDNQQNKKVPLEVSLLTTIKHPNIVTVLDVFENDNCFQMVMEKHGSGMDLFEFIEREPVMDEALTSYIFRQVVSALSYLHSLFILHRDIKDENIIMDEHFHVKLIDFGSATFMGEELFSTFCGTMEYCSPEVIQGNKYRGPELEMWALGVTLYTLIFSENPFIDVDETLKGEIRISRSISDDLSCLIHHLLEPDPLKRCTLLEVEQNPWVTQPVSIENYTFSEVISASSEEINPPKYITSFLDANILSSSNYTDSGVSSDTKKSTSTQPHSSTESEADSLS